MKLGQGCEAFTAIRNNERMRASLSKHLSEVRQQEMETLAQGTDRIEDVRFMQGRISVLTELLKLTNS